MLQPSVDSVTAKIGSLKLQIASESSEQPAQNGVSNDEVSVPRPARRCAEKEFRLDRKFFECNTRSRMFVVDVQIPSVPLALNVTRKALFNACSDNDNIRYRRCG